MRWNGIHPALLPVYSVFRAFRSVPGTLHPAKCRHPLRPLSALQIPALCSFHRACPVVFSTVSSSCQCLWTFPTPSDKSSASLFLFCSDNHSVFPCLSGIDCGSWKKKIASFSHKKAQERLIPLLFHWFFAARFVMIGRGKERSACFPDANSSEIR